MKRPLRTYSPGSLRADKPMGSVGGLHPVHFDYLSAHEHLVAAQDDETPLAGNKGNTRRSGARSASFRSGKILSQRGCQKPIQRLTEREGSRMNTKQAARTALVIVPFFMVLSGCYTQVETVRGTRYYEEYDSAETDTIDEDDSEDSALNYGDNGWYPDYRIGFSYYSPWYYWPSYGFYSSWYSPWYSYPYWNSFYGYHHYPHYYGHGYSGSGHGIRDDTREFGFTRTNGVRRMNPSNNGHSQTADASRLQRTSRMEGARRSSVPHTSFRGESRRNSRQLYTRNQGTSRARPLISPGLRASNQSRPPSFSPSRPSYSPPRSGGGFRGGGGFGGNGRGSAGSRGGGHR